MSSQEPILLLGRLRLVTRVKPERGIYRPAPGTVVRSGPVPVPPVVCFDRAGKAVTSLSTLHRRRKLLYGEGAQFDHCGNGSR